MNTECKYTQHLDAMKYITRKIESILKKAVSQFPSVIVTGSKQSGKTTLLKHLFLQTHNYVSLDNPDIRLMAIREPQIFMDNYPPPLIIDEIQYAPELFSYIKIKIDDNRYKNGQFLLAGSQGFSLMAGVSESLAGRIAVFTLLSFSIKEQINIDKLTNDILKELTMRGGFPELAAYKTKNAQLWFNGYLQTYLERDVRQLRQIGNLTDFYRFLELLASINGQVLNFTNISSDLGVSVNTVKAWISVLEISNQIVIIKPYYKNKGKRIIKSPKIYFLDTGLLCFLNGISHKEQIFKEPLSCQLFENVMLGEIIREFYNNGELPRIYWRRTSHGKEVDFIIERNATLTPIEVKLTSRINRGLIRNLESFCKLFSQETTGAILITLAKTGMTFDKKIRAVSFIDFIKNIN